MAACRTIFNRVSTSINCSSFWQIRKPLPCYEQCAFFKTKDYEKIGIERPPKKPLVPFFKYKEMMYPKLKAENPTLKLQQIVSLIAQKWKEYPDEKKEILRKEAEAEMVTYKENIKEYKERLSPEQHQLIEESKKKSEYAKEVRIRRQKKADSNKPKKPISPYGLYFRDRIQCLDKTQHKYIDLMKTVGKDWENESIDVKKRYRKEYQKLKADYAVQLREWEKKMIEEGNLDVIGTKTLRKLHKELQEKDSEDTKTN